MGHSVNPRTRRALLWAGAALATPLLLAVLFISLFGWNWLRAPLEHKVLQETGRVLEIRGDLSVQLRWPVVRVQAAGVNFANPAWAKEPQMLVADGVEVALDLAPLLHRQVVLPQVQLHRASVFLEHSAEGRKSWLLDLNQQDESARVHIGSIALEQGTLGYDDIAQKIRIRAALSTSASPATPEVPSPSTNQLTFAVKGMFRGQPLTAQGTGGPVLALRDTQAPYPLKLHAKVGPTQLRVDGTVTGLLTLTAVDMHMALQGGSLEQLYPLLGMAFPATPAYTTEGHLSRAGATWRYDKFSGHMGASDIAGFVQVISGGQRPQLTADLRSKLLSLDDLGIVIGARSDSTTTASPPHGDWQPGVTRLAI